MFNEKKIMYSLVVTGLECGPYSSFYVEGKWEQAWRAAGELTPDSYAGITLTDRYAADGECGPAGPPIALTDAALEKGWEIFRDKFRNHYSDAIRENDDAITGDTFLQCVAFGDAIYG